MLENYLIEYCSPTLASLKSGSLFNCRCGSDVSIDECIAEWNDRFRSKGISMHLLRRTESRALIYVCRDSALSDTLSDPEVSAFLQSYGYDSCCCCGGCTSGECSIERCLNHLQSRICCGNGASGTEFPHEIGIFLGYPLADVEGFIRNKGQGSKYIGAWKVYGDAAAAKKSFERFDKCSSLYSRLWRSGRRSVMQLTVAG